MQEILSFFNQSSSVLNVWLESDVFIMAIRGY